MSRGIKVIDKGKKRHVCPRPWWFKRLRLGLVVGALIQCRDCGTRWEYEGDDFWTEAR